MPKLPVISGAQLVRLLERSGYLRIRTRGSHVRLIPFELSTDKKKVTVPLHRELKPGTLSNIMKDTGLTVEDLR